jgi:tRNA 2-selenouridine synthase
MIAAIREGRMEDFIRLALGYYDKAYLKGMSHRRPASILRVGMESEDPGENARRLLEAAGAIHVLTYDATH